MKDLDETALWKLKGVMDDTETIMWVTGPEHLVKAQKNMLVFLIVVMLAVAGGNMMIDDGVSPIAKISLLLPMIVVGGALIWLAKRNNRLARYVVTNRQVIMITPRLLGYANAFLVRYPLGPKSFAEVETDLTGSNIGKLTIKSPDHFKNPDKPRQHMILNAINNPANAKRQIDEVIKQL